LGVPRDITHFEQTSVALEHELRGGSGEERVTADGSSDGDGLMAGGAALTSGVCAYYRTSGLMTY